MDSSMDSDNPNESNTNEVVQDVSENLEKNERNEASEDLSTMKISIKEEPDTTDEPPSSTKQDTEMNDTNETNETNEANETNETNNDHHHHNNNDSNNNNNNNNNAIENAEENNTPNENEGDDSNKSSQTLPQDIKIKEEIKEEPNTDLNNNNSNNININNNNNHNISNNNNNNASSSSPVKLEPLVTPPHLTSVPPSILPLIPHVSAPSSNNIKRWLGWNDKLSNYESRVNLDPYDAEAWNALINEVQGQPVEYLRDIYERFLWIFPTVSRVWKLYIEAELNLRNIDRGERLFMRCLRPIPHIDLWKLYIQYIRQINNDTNPDIEPTPSQRENIVKAFEFALEHIGLDISAGILWSDYISFLKNIKTSSTFEESQKMTAVRKLYQKAIEIPMHGIEGIWREYDVYENGLNKLLATEMIKQHAPRYTKARAYYRERKAMMEGILRTLPPRPAHGSEKEEHQVSLWKRLISFEKVNHQGVDVTTLRARVTFTYNQCLLHLYRYPDIWYEAAMYQYESANNAEGAIQFFERGLIALPDSLLLFFAYADFMELLKKNSEARDIYERLLKNTQVPLAYIQYMRFSRRVEGVNGPRKIFKNARASPLCSYHVYVALAYIEYFVNKDSKVARNAFEAGMTKYPNTPALTQHYISFLEILNAENNTRALFEKILSTLGKDKSALDVINKFLTFEYTQSMDLSAITKLEKRKLQLFEESDPTGILTLVQRYKYLNLWPCTPAQLESFTQSTAKTALPPPLPIPPPTRASERRAERERIPRPDVSQMIVYRSDAPTPQAPLPIPSLPEFLQPLISILPTALNFGGPYVDVELMLQMLHDLPLPTTPPIQPVAFPMGNNNEPPPVPIQQTTTTSTSTAPKEGWRSSKRKVEEEGSSDSETESVPTPINRPVSSDIYRGRIAAKIAKKPGTG